MGSEPPGSGQIRDLYSSTSFAEPEGEKEVVLEVEEGDPAWVSLGVFSLPAGVSRVVLDDRGAPPITAKNGATYVQLVVADAVKWVKQE